MLNTKASIYYIFLKICLLLFFSVWIFSLSTFVCVYMCMCNAFADNSVHVFVCRPEDYCECHSLHSPLGFWGRMSHCPRAPHWSASLINHSLVRQSPRDSPPTWTWLFKNMAFVDRSQVFMLLLQAFTSCAVFSTPGSIFNFSNYVSWRISKP